LFLLLAAVLVPAGTVLDDPAMADGVRAEVVRAVFYPDAAEFTARAALPLAGTPSRPVAVLLLPAQADPSSLAVTPEKGLAVADLTWERKERVRSGQGQSQGQSQGQILARELEERKRARAGIEAKVAAAAARLEFWKGHGAAPARTPAEARQLAQALSEDVERTAAGKYELDRALEKANREVAALEAKLARVAGPEDAAWEVSVFLAPAPQAEGPGQPLAKPAARPMDQPVRLVWSYRLSGCGWRPISRLDARPGEGQVLFATEAEIWQNSGAALTQAEISLAALPRAVSVDLPPVPDWVIQPRPEPVPRPEGAPMAKNRAAAPMLAVASMDAGAAPPAPAFGQHATVGLWDLGRREIPAGEKTRLTLTQAAWPADFLWVLRPALDSRAFLRAKCRLPEPMDLPPSQALYLVEGSALGQRTLSLAGDEATLFFGPDPLVTGKEKLADKKSGESGIVGQKQTHRWDWTIEVKNAKNRAVPVLVESARPLSRDERIKVEVTAEPKPEAPAAQDQDAAHLLTWRLTPKPGEKTLIKLTVTASAPADLKLDTGRR
jgi:uncharacterized protein (TIGR02231 family)